MSILNTKSNIGEFTMMIDSHPIHQHYGKITELRANPGLNNAAIEIISLLFPTVSPSLYDKTWLRSNLRQTNDSTDIMP